MELKDQVCTKSQGDKIKLFGVTFESYFHWSPYYPSGGIKWQILDARFFLKNESVPAYTVAELMEMLPRSMVMPNDHSICPDRWYLWVRKSGKPGYVAIYCEDDEEGTLHSSGNKTLAETLSDMLIWLIENNHVKPEDLNK